MALVDSETGAVVTAPYLIRAYNNGPYSSWVVKVAADAPVEILGYRHATMPGGRGPWAREIVFTDMRVIARDNWWSREWPRPDIDWFTVHMSKTGFDVTSYRFEPVTPEGGAIGNLAQVSCWLPPMNWTRPTTVVVTNF